MCGAVGASKPSDLMSPTTPTIVNEGMTPWRAAAKSNLFAQRIFLRPVSPLESLIDQHDLLRLIRVGLGEVSSGEQRDLQHAEIIGCSRSKLRDGSTL